MTADRPRGPPGKAGRGNSKPSSSTPDQATAGTMMGMPTQGSSSAVGSFQPLRRRMPVQARAQRTIEKILQAASEILVESGLPALNTNAIAARSNVNISTLYSYFPDKKAIVLELSARFEDARGQFLAERMGELAESDDWEGMIDTILDGFVQIRIEVPGGADLRRALQAMPELRELDEQSTRRSGSFVGDAIYAANPAIGRERARAVGLTIAETVTRLLDLAFESHPYDEVMVEEMRVLTKRYVMPYVGQELGQHQEEPPPSGKGT